MITPSFSLTATERVLPRMALDFTTASLDSRVTFTRTGNTATVVNSSGLVAPINANLPRFDFDPITLACKGLLIEESRTNLLTYSDDFRNTLDAGSSRPWSYSGVTLTVNATTSPDGTANADRLVETATTGEHKVFRGLAATIATTYTWSVFAKKGERNWIYLDTADGVDIYTFFDLNSGVVGNVGAGVTARIENYGNGWYRCIATKTATTAAIFFQFGLSTANGVFSYSGDITKGAFFYGSQLEVGSFATSYIPTVASTVIRNVDVASMTSTNFSSWYTATTGAAVVWAIPQTATGTRPLIQFDDTTANEIISLRGNVADPEMSIVDGGVAQAQIDTGTIVANTAYKLSGAWNTNNCAAAKDGGTVGTDNTATIPTPTQLRIGSDGTNYASAWVQKILYYPQRLINAEVQAISK